MNWMVITKITLLIAVNDSNNLIQHLPIWVMFMVVPLSSLLITDLILILLNVLRPLCCALTLG